MRTITINCTLLNIIFLCLPIVASANIGWLMPISDYIFKGELSTLPTPTCIYAPLEVEYQENYTISWCDVTNATSYNLVDQQGYIVYSGPNLTFQISNIEGSYSYKVSACNNSGCSEGSIFTNVVVKPLKIPTGIPTVSGNIDSFEAVPFQLNWTASNDNVSYYQVEIDYNGQTNIEIVSEQSLQQEYILSGNRTYRVQACNQTGCGQFSEAFSSNVL